MSACRHGCDSRDFASSTLRGSALNEPRERERNTCDSEQVSRGPDTVGSRYLRPRPYIRDTRRKPRGCRLDIFNFSFRMYFCARESPRNGSAVAKNDRKRAEISFFFPVFSRSLVLFPLMRTIENSCLAASHEYAADAATRTRHGFGISRNSRSRPALRGYDCAKEVPVTKRFKIIEILCYF